MNKEIEKSIIKRYRKEIWAKFVKAVKEYELISENDKIAVCISGGKDSFLLAKCMQELLRHGKFHYTLEFIVMNPGYSKENIEKIKENLKTMEIDAHIFDTPIFEYTSTTDNPCYLCAKMRRGYLYSYAKKLGCNKIALGHHFNDVIETALLNIFYTGRFGGMPPKLRSDNYQDMELIRPLYLVKEDAIISWRKYNELTFINCACRFTEGCSLINDGTSKRKEIKELIKNLRKINPNVDHNIFKSLDNVNLNCVLGTKKEGIYHSFLETYENKNRKDKIS